MRETTSTSGFLLLEGLEIARLLPKAVLCAFTTGITRRPEWRKQRTASAHRRLPNSMNGLQDPAYRPLFLKNLDVDLQQDGLPLDTQAVEVKA